MIDQEKIFKYVTGDKYVVAEKIPEQKGNLEKYKVIRLEAEKDMDGSAIVRAMIAGLGTEPPKHGGEEVRVRQLRTLIESYMNTEKQSVVCLISNAHLLPPRAFRAIKSIHEIMHGTSYVGFVFLGDLAKLRKKMEKIETIHLRTDYHGGQK